MTYLLDTDVLSEWRKASPNPGVEKWFRQIDVEELFLSVVTVGEIRRGISRLQRRDEHRLATVLESWLLTIKARFADRVLPVTVEVAEQWGHFDAHKRLPVPDALIAATAHLRGWAVVTRNVKAFEPTGVRVLNPFTE